MDEKKAKELIGEFIKRITDEAGAQAVQGVSIRMPNHKFEAITVNGLLVADTQEAIEQLGFVSKQLPLAPIEVSDIFPLRPRTRGYRFVDGGGETIKDGKSIHPDFIRVYINRAEAFTFAMNILRQLEHPRLPPQEENPLLEIPLFGQLERVAEDDSN